MPKIRDFLQEDFPSVSIKDSLETVMDRLLDTSRPREEFANCLVVLDAEMPVGLINGWLLLRALAIGAEKEGEPAVDTFMKDRLKLPVSSAMSEEFPVAAPEDDLFDVLGMLGENYFQCLPVMEEGEYVGAVHAIDIFQAVADEVLGVTSGGVFTE